MRTSSRLPRSSWGASLALAIGVVLHASTHAAAQEPVKGFDQLSSRLRPGSTIYVTDATGREVKGKVLEVTSTSLSLSGQRTFSESQVRAIFQRPPDSLKTGALVGLGVGVGTVMVLTAMYGGGDGVELAYLYCGGIGAAIGAGIDAAIPWPKQLVYAAPGGKPGAHLSVAPVITPRTKGVALSLGF